VLFEKGDEEVDRKDGVCGDLRFGHIDVSDGDSHAQNLLELELDSGLDFKNLPCHIVVRREQSRELTSLVEAGTENTGLSGKIAFERRADARRHKLVSKTLQNWATQAQRAGNAASAMPATR
jgi:hypothetical protein